MMSGRLELCLVLLACQALQLLQGEEGERRTFERNYLRRHSFSAPSLGHSLTTPLVKLEGDDALLTCVVQNQNNLTLMWKRDTRGKVGTKILTANTARITSDKRISVIHEEGGQVGRGQVCVW